MLGWRDFNVSDVPVQVLHGRTLRSFLWPSSPEQWSSDTWSVGTDEVRLYPSLRVTLVISTKCRDKQECCLALLTEPLNDNVRLSSIYKCFALCVTVSRRRQPIFISTWCWINWMKQSHCVDEFPHYCIFYDQFGWISQSFNVPNTNNNSHSMVPLLRAITNKQTQKCMFYPKVTL